MLVLLIILHIFILSQIQFTAWPEMFSFPYLLNNGFNLYKDMVHPYPPLLTYFLAFVYRNSGYQLISLKIVTYVLLIINDILIYKIVEYSSQKKKIALLTVGFYIFTQSFLEGNQLWFDTAIVTPILFGYLFFQRQNFLLSGLAFGVASLIKQNSALFVILGALILLAGKKLKNFLKFLIFPGTLFVFLMIYLFVTNSINDFFNWVLIYPSKYWTDFPGYIQMVPSKKQFLQLVVIFSPLFFLILQRKFKEKIFLLGSIVVSIILVYPRFSFFHFQTGIAFLAIIFGIFSEKFKKIGFIYLLFILIAMLMLFPKTEIGNCVRFLDDNNLKIIQKEKVYLLGFHSLNYVINDVLPPKPWIDNFAWSFEIPEIQNKTIKRWEVDPPIFIYWSKPQDGNWYDLGTYQPDKIVKYIKENYEKISEQNDMEIWKLIQK